MTKLFNPTANDITVTIYGVEYVVDGNGTIDVPEDVVKYWTGELHTFLQVREEVVKKEAEVIEVKTKKTK